MPDEYHMLKVPIKYKLDPSVPVNQRHVIICEDLRDPKVVDTALDRHLKKFSFSKNIFYITKTYQMNSLDSRIDAKVISIRTVFMSRQD
jgi:hypothetical protein